MSTTLIKNHKNGISEDTFLKLTNKQRMFVLELLASDTFSPTEAAEKVGYAQPSTAAYKLLRNPAIAKALGKAQRLREERCELKVDDVLDYLRRGLFLNPLDYFRPGKDGRWELTDPDSLPPEVGRLIEKMDVKVEQGKDGTERSSFTVTLVSKTTMLTLALKYLGLTDDRVTAVVQQAVTLYWDQLASASTGISNPVHERLRALEDASESFVKANGQVGSNVHRSSNKRHLGNGDDDT